MSFDLAIVESMGNGGDLQIVGSDLAVVYGSENMPYLGMFGGNIEASTSNQTSNLSVTSQNFDYWANNLLMKNNSSAQFNSITEKIINSTALNSVGRIAIENAIKTDLQFLAPSAKITVTVTIVATDKINVNIEIRQSDNVSVTIINFKKSADGDFLIVDFNLTDFYI